MSKNIVLSIYRIIARVLPSHPFGIPVRMVRALNESFNAPNHKKSFRLGSYLVYRYRTISICLWFVDIVIELDFRRHPTVLSTVNSEREFLLFHGITNSGVLGSIFSETTEATDRPADRRTQFLDGYKYPAARDPKTEAVVRTCLRLLPPLSLNH